MMDWPEGNKSARFTDIAGPLRHAFLQGAKWSRINADKDIEWTGLPLGPQTNACCHEPEDQLRAETLKYALEDQGYDFLDEFIGLVLRLGMEQGRRTYLSGTVYSLRQMQLRMAFDSLKPLLDTEITEAATA